METMGGSPFAWLRFNKDGGLIDPSEPEAIRRLVAANGVSDLVIISHGWKNDEGDARNLYSTLWGHVATALKTRKPENVVLCGIQWPAKAFATDFDVAALRVQQNGGGTLSAAPPSGTPRRDMSATELEAAMGAFESFVGGAAPTVVLAAREVVRTGALDPSKAPDLFAAASDLFRHRGGNDSELSQDTRPLGAADPHVRLLGLAKPPVLAVAPDVGAARSVGDEIGQGLGQVFAGPRAAVARFLNQLTYFEMKARAGDIGRELGAGVVSRLGASPPVRLHLVGHSFGARLVTAAASALPGGSPLFSLTLLQGAFSHNAMAQTVEPGVPGVFANVVGRPSGPIVMTHTHNDEACTFWYAIASRLARDVAKALGDKNDMFGAMGANGAQKLKSSDLAADVSDTNFSPVPGKVNRFLADGYVVKTSSTDAHNNVTNEACGRLVASVLDMT